MSDQKKPSRRDFLKGSSAAIAGTTLAGGLSITRSAHAAGSDVIKVALIGAGGRGSGAVGQQMGVDDNVQLVAVADAFENRANGTANAMKKRFGERGTVPQDRIFIGLNAYKDAIAAGPDVVVIGTPPGFKPMQYKAAIDAGKHVFMEKPCCVDAPGYKTLIAASKMADEKGLCVGVGLQRRHETRYIETIKRIHDGAIGDVLFTRVYWNGTEPWNRRRREGMTEMEYQVHNWYHFCWVSGDNIGEQHIHNIDIGNWVQGDQHPVEANGMGGCTTRYLGGSKGRGQIFDHHFVEYTYENGAKMYSQCRHMRDCWGSVSEAAHGTEGTSNCNGHIAGANEWRFSGNSPGGHQQEQTDLLATLRAGNRYNEGYYGADSSMTAVLGRVANYSGQRVRWDELVEKGKSEMPETLGWDVPAPVQKDANGDYPIPVPGQFPPF